MLNHAWCDYGAEYTHEMEYYQPAASGLHTVKIKFMLEDGYSEIMTDTMEQALGGNVLALYMSESLFQLRKVTN